MNALQVEAEARSRPTQRRTLWELREIAPETGVTLKSNLPPRWNRSTPSGGQPAPQGIHPG
jgi:hypothetical protein